MRISTKERNPEILRQVMAKWGASSLLWSDSRHSSNTDSHYVTDQAEETTMETFSKNSWGISFTRYTKQGLFFRVAEQKLRTYLKHMALLTVIFTPVNKNKILTCTGMQKWNKTLPFPPILWISNFTHLILKWQYHSTNWYTVPNIVHTTLHTSITHYYHQEIVVQ